MAKAYVLIDDMEMTLEEYENYTDTSVDGQEQNTGKILHALGFEYDEKYSVKDENGAVI